MDRLGERIKTSENNMIKYFSDYITAADITADDWSRPLQEAIDDSTASGSILYCEPGKYKIANVELKTGLDMRCSRHTSHLNSTWFVAKHATASLLIDPGTAIQYVYVQGGVWSGGETVLRRLVTGSGGAMHHCHFSDMAVDATSASFSLKNNVSCKFSNIRTFGATTSGSMFLLEGSTDGPYHHNDLIIDRCRGVSRPAGHLIDAQLNNANSNNVRVTNCLWEGNAGEAIKIKGAARNWLIEQMWTEDNESPSLHFDGTGGHIRNAIVRSCYFGRHRSGSVPDHHAKVNFITGIRFEDNTFVLDFNTVSANDPVAVDVSIYNDYLPVYLMRNELMLFNAPTSPKPNYDDALVAYPAGERVVIERLPGSSTVADPGISMWYSGSIEAVELTEV
jgi:hypothetical protein